MESRQVLIVRNIIIITASIMICSASPAATALTVSIVRMPLLQQQRGFYVRNGSLYAASRLRSDRRRSTLRNEKDQVTSVLNWENYEFSTRPKADKRFDDALSNNDLGDLSTVMKKEAEKDISFARQIEEKNNAFLGLPPDLITAAIRVLEPCINSDRLERVKSVYRQRTKRSKFLFENPSNPSNVWACLRTIDSFGIQSVDLVIDSGTYAGKAAITQKRGMRTAMGSAQWLSLKNHASTKAAVEDIRDKQGYKIYASDLNPDSKDVRDLDWDCSPICVVMGNEERGITDEMKQLADETFSLPMVGFAESFNLSVATSITLAYMSASSKNGSGPLRPGDMDEHEFSCLYLKGLIQSLPQRNMGPMILRQKGIVLPNIFAFL